MPLALQLQKEPAKTPITTAESHGELVVWHIAILEQLPVEKNGFSGELRVIQHLDWDTNRVVVSA
jgi:hypothetical protein